MEGPPTKRARLSMACNQCRRRKVKCDAEYPKCRNCRMRSDECITEDPRRPGVGITREWIEGSTQQPPLDQARDCNLSEATGHQSPELPTQPSPAPTAPSVRVGPFCETPGISPVHQPHEMAFNLDQSSNRIKMMGGSSSQTLAKSLDVYFKSAHVKPLSNHFTHSMRHVEEWSLPTTLSWPLLPEISRCEMYMTVFFSRVHILYPLLDIDQTKNQIRRFARLQDLKAIPPEQISILACAYVIISLGADEKAQRITADGEKYLKAATGLLSHILLMPYLSSLQCLILLTIAFRGRNKDGVAWQFLGMAIRIAQSLGIHRFSSVQPSSQHGIQTKYQQLFHARVWGICCCLEKTMELETGRPSAITTVDTDQMMGPEQRAPGHDFLQWYMGLAKYQGQISQHIYGHRFGVRSTRQILMDTGKLDAALLSWVNQIPQEFRPGTDLFCSNEEFHIASFLSMQYNQAMIALHRAALIAPSQPFEQEVSNHCSDQPSQYRLKKGESICVNSARSIARLSIELADRGAHSIVCPIGSSLLACIVLGIYLMKNTSSRLQAADVETLKACAELTSEQYLKSGMDTRFCEVPIAIYEQVHAHYNKSVSNNNRVAAHEKDQDGTNTSLRNGGRQVDNPIHAPPSYIESTLRYNARINQEARELQHQQYGVSTVNATAEVDRNLSIGDENQFFPGLDKPMEDSVPFMGLNIEDLWNWMGASDPGEVFSWGNSSSNFEGNADNL